VKRLEEMKCAEDLTDILPDAEEINLVDLFSRSSPLGGRELNLKAGCSSTQQLNRFNKISLALTIKLLKNVKN
jgi:hypothetical protein